MNIEGELIYRAKRGDMSAFEDLISGYEKKVYNTVYRFFNNAEDAMDVSQEIFIKIFTSLDKFRGESSFSTWLYRIAVNTCIDFSRKHREATLPIHEESEIHNHLNLGTPTQLPEEFIENKEIRQAIADAINMLPEEQKICVILRDVQGFSYAEIGEILNCSLGTVKSRLYRGRRNLRELLKDMGIFSQAPSDGELQRGEQHGRM
ncbi:sigma-70 family RNA polymerase sigma factor [Tepidanaerobacter sp. EBM-49]|uniref:RNA polymerase sigma factor n=1 Tax=Tepidanaerobacter sp. EBM-49 TaxID=1918504 RepID=UPI000A3FAE9C|nr:sigma-70 family RNA polymerase sigma factor [Tepidanaerobacter sp. EBM-49]